MRLGRYLGLCGLMLVCLLVGGCAHTAAVAIIGVTLYLEHADTTLEAGKKSLTRTSSLFTLLQIGTNYHNEHHMYAY